jgi:hypothetical protein
MEKIIQFAKNKGYEVKVEPIYSHKILEVDRWGRFNPIFQDVFGSRKLEPNSLLVRFLKGFNIYVMKGHFDEGGYWLPIFRIEKGTNGYNLSKLGGTEFKYFKKSLRGFLAGKVGKSYVPSGFLAGKGDLGKSYVPSTIKVDLDFNLNESYLKHLDYKFSRSINLIGKKTSLVDDLVFNNIVDLSFDIENMRKYGIEDKNVNWVTENCYLEYDFTMNVHSISIDNLSEIGLESYIRDKKLEKLLL